MALREAVFDNLIGDLEYHPKRGILYLALGVAALCFWTFAPSDNKLSLIPLVFGAGSITLFLKGVFLLRKTSDGLGLSQEGLSISQHEIAQFPSPSPQKTFQPIPTLVAQLIQDFGAGAFLLGPVPHIGNNINVFWNNLPSFSVFLTGAALFLVGWVIRRLSSSAPLHG